MENEWVQDKSGNYNTTLELDVETLESLNQLTLEYVKNHVIEYQDDVSRSMFFSSFDQTFNESNDTARAIGVGLFDMFRNKVLVDVIVTEIETMKSKME